MTMIERLSNSAIAMQRDDLENILRSLTAIQEVSGLAASIIIDRLNEVDGDPDNEPTGDEADSSWTEFHTRGRHKQAGGGFEMEPGFAHEDAEDDDPDTGVEDGQFDPEEDYGIDDVPHDQEHELIPTYGIDQSKGPINEIEANRERKVEELGFVPNRRVGWRLPPTR